MSRLAITFSAALISIATFAACGSQIDSADDQEAQSSDLASSKSVVGTWSRLPFAEGGTAVAFDKLVLTSSGSYVATIFAPPCKEAGCLPVADFEETGRFRTETTAGTRRLTLTSAEGAKKTFSLMTVSATKLTLADSAGKLARYAAAEKIPRGCDLDLNPKCGAGEECVVPFLLPTRSGTCQKKKTGSP